MDNALCDDSCLAASRAGNDEQRSITVFNRLELFRVELQHESNQVDRRWSKVESGLKGKVAGIREKKQAHVPESCSSRRNQGRTTPLQHPTERSHSSIHARAVPMFSRVWASLSGPRETGFRIRDSVLRYRWHSVRNQTDVLAVH